MKWWAEHPEFGEMRLSVPGPGNHGHNVIGGVVHVDKAAEKAINKYIASHKMWCYKAAKELVEQRAKWLEVNAALKEAKDKVGGLW
jgi:hypothetical protein